MIVFSKPKPKIYGPNGAECSKSGMSQKTPEMMSPIHRVCRAQSTPSCACPASTCPSNPYSKPPDNNMHHARFSETLLTSTLVVFITGQMKNTLTYLNRRLVKSTVVHSNTPCHHIRRYVIIIHEKNSHHTKFF